jgi:ABC-type Fe3+-hydroxamate transport system substrate-binding protein
VCGHARPAGIWVGTAIVLAAGCSDPPAESDTPSTPEATEILVLDASGREVSLAAPARRIVSLVPSATRTLHALGAAEALAGRTDFDAQAWAESIPSVGGGVEPNLETLVALEPDLVVRFAGAQDPRTPARLDDLGIPHLAIRPDQVSDIYQTVQLLGAVTGLTGEADSLVAAIRDGLGEVAERVADLPRLRVTYIIGGTPPWVAGPGTYIDEIVSLAGGDNVFFDLDALYSAVSPEQLRTRDVEVVLVSDQATLDRSLTPGARVAVLGDILEIPGPGVVAAATRVAELLHGPGLP